MTGVFTTAYAAPIGYYKTILRCDASYIEVNENFIKQTIRNRCIIATSNGPLTLSIPLLGRRNNMSVSEIMICYKQSWQRQHIKSMETAYHSSPFFEFYHDDLKALYAIQPNSLLEWNNLVHQFVLKCLKHSLTFEPTTSYQKTYEHDFRNNEWKGYSQQHYHQVFESKLSFMPDLSIYDLMFNHGSMALQYLKS